MFSTGASRFGPHGERTWWKIEKPALLDNSSVNKVTRMKKDGKASKIGHIIK